MAKAKDAQDCEKLGRERGPLLGLPNSEQLAQHHPEVVGDDVDEVALADFDKPTDPRSPPSTRFAGVREAALDDFATCLGRPSETRYSQRAFPSSEAERDGIRRTA